jgi:hypothetical protein
MRVYPIQPNEGLPLLIVDTASERVSDPYTLDTQKVALDVAVTIYADTVSPDWHHTVDALCAEVEQLLPYTLTDLPIVESLTYQSTQIDLTEEVLAMATLTFTCTYIRTEPPEATDLYDLTDAQLGGKLPGRVTF